MKLSIPSLNIVRKKMKRLIRNLVPVSIMLALMSSAHAGESGYAPVQRVEIINDVVIFIMGTHNNKPPCSTQGDEWAFSLSSPGGKARYAALLTAKALNKRVTGYGTNTCDAWGDRETVQSLSIEN